MMPIEEQPKPDASDIAGPMLPIDQEVARGLRFTHLMLLAMDRQAKETAQLTERLKKLMTAKGITNDSDWANALDQQTSIPRDFPLGFQISDSLVDCGKSEI